MPFTNRYITALYWGSQHVTTYFFTLGRWKCKRKNKTVENAKQAIPNTLTPSLVYFVRIICALCNRFPSPFSPTEELDTLDQLTLTMLQKSKEPNRLLGYLQVNELLIKRKVYTDLKDHILDNFPKFSLDDLRNITLGVYQLIQAASYTKVVNYMKFLFTMNDPTSKN